MFPNCLPFFFFIHAIKNSGWLAQSGYLEFNKSCSVLLYSVSWSYQSLLLNKQQQKKNYLKTILLSFKKKKKKLQWISPVNCIFCLWAFSELFPWSVRQGILPASFLSRSRGKLTHLQLSSSIADIWFTHFHSTLALHPIAFFLCTVLSCGSFQENAFNF